MNINELQPRQGDVDIIVEIVKIEPPREFQKFGKPGKVANAIIKDTTGDMKLTLWNEQIDQVKPGDKVHIQKGYVNEWQGEKQLTTGKFGTLDVVESAEPSTEEEQKPSSEQPATEPAPEEQPKQQETVEEPKPTEEKSSQEDILEETVEEEEIK